MAKSNPLLINALRQTSERLSKGEKYEWGHMGRCNCGHLVQTITSMSAREIVEAVEHELNEWTEHAREYCESTNSKAESIFRELREVGFDYDDFVKLEYLSDKRVLDRIGEPPVFLSKNNVDDVILYMETMADLLEEEPTYSVS